MNLGNLQTPRSAFADAVAPPPDLKVSEWARANFRLSSDYSAVTGEFVPHPYQIEPLDVLSPGYPCDMVVLMCGAQMMKTLIMLVFLGYIIDNDPGPVLIVQPSESDADSFSKERIAPMIRDVPAVAAKVEESRGRDSGNTILQKRFRGGQVSLTGAVSPRGLRRRSVRYLMLDEVDGYDPTSEGDPLALAIMRTVTFWNRKIAMCSTPTDQGRSRITKHYDESDQRKYFVPCPFCGFEQPLIWERVKWGIIEGEIIEPRDAHYECASCKILIPHYHKIDMIQRGRWIAQNPDGRYPGFHISRLYAPDWSWGRIVTEEFLPKKDDPQGLKAFINTILAETWKAPGENAPDWEKLSSRREEYRLGEVPPGVLFLTAATDVQKSWIEGYVVGWGRGRQRWIIDRYRFEGDPYGQEVWDQLGDQLGRTYQHPCGLHLPISRMAVDSGHATNQVYLFARRHGINRVLAVDGRDRGTSLVGSPSSVDVTIRGNKIKSGVKLWPVNVSDAKSELYGYLNRERPEDGTFPPGWVHFPADLDDEFFKQLTAEQVQSRIVKGYTKYEWVKLRERNEALDCVASYARAAAYVVGMDRFQEHHWAELESRLSVQVAQQQPDEPQQQSQPQPQPVPQPQQQTRKRMEIRLL